MPAGPRACVWPPVSHMSHTHPDEDVCCPAVLQALSQELSGKEPRASNRSMSLLFKALLQVGGCHKASSTATCSRYMSRSTSGACQSLCTTHTWNLGPTALLCACASHVLFCTHCVPPAMVCTV